MMNPELEDALEDRSIFERDMRAMQNTMWFFMKLWWLFLPFTLFAPAWNAVSKSPMDQGKWIGFAIVGCFVVPFWVAFGVVGRRLRNTLDDLAEQDAERQQVKAAKRKILLARAERMERAEARLRRIKAARMDEERQEIVEDLDRLRGELDDPE